MRFARCGWIALGLWACHSGELPDPTVTEVVPLRMRTDESTTLSFKLDGTLPFRIDYQARGRPVASVQNTVSVWLGLQELGRTAVDEEQRGRLALVPFLPAGTYELQIRLEDGRTSTASDPFVLDPGEFPDSFTWEPVPDPRRGIPFTVTLRAQGGRGALFGGYVQLSASRGNVTPARLGPFINGEVTAELVLYSLGNTTLTATDAANHSGTSNDFQVRP